MVDSVVLIANEIIKELKLGYGLSETEYEKLLKKLENIKVSIIDFKDKEIRYDFYTETQKLYGTHISEQIGQSHTVEYPPILENDQVIKLLPIVNIQHYEDSEEFVSSSYHELVHFFSIGEWKVVAKTPNEAIVEHYYGIIKKQFKYCSSNITYEFSEITLLNEVITDWIAQFLYEKIEGSVYHAGMTYRKTPIYKFLVERIQTECEAKAFIGAYLTNKIDALIRYLLTDSEFDSFEALEGDDEGVSLYKIGTTVKV